MPEETETITAYGHENVQATHKTTLEITKDKHLTKNGDCVIAIAADKSLADLSPKFKERLRGRKTKLTIRINVGRSVEILRAQGNPYLILSHPSAIVLRKSDYVCSRTLAIRSDKAAGDLSRSFVEKLKKPGRKVRIVLIIENCKR